MKIILKRPVFFFTLKRQLSYAENETKIDSPVNRQPQTTLCCTKSIYPLKIQLFIFPTTLSHVIRLTDTKWFQTQG